MDALWQRLKSNFGSASLPLYEDIGVANGQSYPEVDARA